MATWPEARAAKTQRQRQQRRFYSTDRLGARCVVCGERMPTALEAEGHHAHPTCGPEYGALVARSRRAQEVRRTA